MPLDQTDLQRDRFPPWTYDIRPHLPDMEMQARILVIDGDEGLSSLLVTYLGKEGFGIDLAPNGDEGHVMALSGEYSLCVLDVMLP